MSNTIALKKEDAEMLIRKLPNLVGRLRYSNSRIYLKINLNKIKHNFEIPSLPGVYFFWSDALELMYIGSSKNLNQRIPTSLKERNFSVSFLSYTVCDSEEEARDHEELLIYLLHPRGNSIVKFDVIHSMKRISTVNPFTLKKYEVDNEFVISDVI